MEEEEEEGGDMEDKHHSLFLGGLAMSREMRNWFAGSLQGNHSEECKGETAGVHL